MTITFKQQGNGTKSWYIDGVLTYESPVNKYHNEMLQGYLKDLNYLSIGEVSMWVNDADYGKEAQALINWWTTTCKLVADYVDLHPNEETAEEFILTIPTL
jgi:hypothetical protein